jgi:hypothetical protein
MKKETPTTEVKKREVPKQVQNELFALSEPFIDKMIEAHKNEGLGFSRYSLQEIGIQCAAIGYYHCADKKTPQPTTEVKGVLHTEITRTEINTILAALVMTKTRYNTTDNGGIFYDFSFKNTEAQNEYAQTFEDVEMKLRKIFNIN